MRRAPTSKRGYRRPAVAAVGLLALATLRLGAPLAQADTAPAPGTPATVSADALPTWQINGVVWSSVTIGTTVYATGNFSTARPPGVAVGGAGEIAVGNLIAYDLTTGNRIAAFSHTLNAQGQTITASPDGTRIYVGGDFTTVDGQPRNRIAAFNTATNALDPGFHPSMASRVSAITATNTTVYAGGTFTTVGGVARTRLAAMSATTGALTAWAPSADDASVKAMVLTPDGSKVIIGGQFSTLDHLSAPGLGAISTADGSLQPWAANTIIKDFGPHSAILALRTDGTLIYGSGYGYKAGNFEGSFAANPSDGQLLYLNDCLGDTYDLLPAGQTLYIVGHPHDCSSVGAFPETTPRTWHRALAFTNYATGHNIKPDANKNDFTAWPDSTLLHWFPTLATGSFTGQTQAAWSITGNGNYIALGGEFPTVNGVAQQGLTRFAVRAIAPNKSGPLYTSTLAPTATAAGSGTAQVNWTSTWDMDNASLTYKLLRDSSSTPIYQTTASSTFWLMPPQSFTDSGLVPGSSHTYKLTVVDPLGNIKYSGVSAPVTIS